MSTAKPRVAALDVLRGLAVAGMILVVSPGDWAQRFVQLNHADWNGATVADMVFPTFLFSVGMALGLSFPRSLGMPDERWRFWTKLLRRTAALIVLGLAVEASFVIVQGALAPFPDGGDWFGHVRIPGILQRIGLCYALAGSLLYATLRRDADGMARIAPLAVAACALTLLVGYWLLIAFVPVPGIGAGLLTPAGSLPGYLDRIVFTEPHLWPLGSATAARPATYDPEGLLSTLPATANVLFGALAAWIWTRAPVRAWAGIAAAGVVLIALGLLLDPVMVINKRIWTPSFALLSSGVSAMTLAALAVMLRHRVVEIMLTPLRVLGGNAILAFLLSTLASRFAMLPIMSEAGRRVTPQAWGFQEALAITSDPRIASLLCALGVLALVTLAIWPLHRRAVHFRI